MSHLGIYLLFVELYSTHDIELYIMAVKQDQKRSNPHGTNN